jgi:hypothetical protein
MHKPAKLLKRRHGFPLLPRLVGNPPQQERDRNDEQQHPPQTD